MAQEVTHAGFNEEKIVSLGFTGRDIHGKVSRVRLTVTSVFEGSSASEVSMATLIRCSLMYAALDMTLGLAVNNEQWSRVRVVIM